MSVWHDCDAACAVVFIVKYSIYILNVLFVYYITAPFITTKNSVVDYLES